MLFRKYDIHRDNVTDRKPYEQFSSDGRSESWLHKPETYSVSYVNKKAYASESTYTNS